MHHDHDRVKLIISEAQAIDAGNYVLCAKNIAGIAYSSCDIAVQLEMTMDDSEAAIRPTVLLPLKDVHSIEGKSVQLQCEIRGQPEPEVIWYKDGKPIKESSDVQLLFRGDRCSLFIQEAYLEDEGVYQVVAINSAGEASSKCHLTIKPLNKTDPAKRSTAISNDTIDGFAPRFEKLLCDILVNEGETIELECLVIAKPKPQIKWLISNKEIHESDHIQFEYNDDDGKTKLKVKFIKIVKKNQLQTTNSFPFPFQQIKNVTSDDKGVYTVHATNTLGDAKCFSHLIVKSVNVTENLPTKPIESESFHHFLEFKEMFSDKSVCIGDSAKFECIVVGKPIPRIRWLFNDRPVQGKNFLTSTSGNRQVLTIPAIDAESIGKITCLAENEFHRESCSAYLHQTAISEFQPPLSTKHTEHYTQEYDTNSSSVIIKKQSEISTKCTTNVTSHQNGTPQVVSIHSNNGAGGDIVPNEQHLVNYGSNEFEKSTVSQAKFSTSSTENLFPKTQRKESAPRFMSPLIGKIIEQGSNIMLEALIDGVPAPEIQISKNGEPLFEKGNLNILRKNNRVTISIANASVADAGRYEILATNSVGCASSSADIVVKRMSLIRSSKLSVFHN